MVPVIQETSKRVWKIGYQDNAVTNIKIMIRELLVYLR